LKASHTERTLQQKHARHLTAQLKARALPVAETPSHIVPVMVGDPVKCKALTDRLLEEFSIYVQPISYQPCPRARTHRFSRPLHGELEIARLVDALDRLGEMAPARGGVIHR
jgi:5-aminolevulinate synthase